MGAQRRRNRGRAHVTYFLLLVLAGIGAGLASTMAGLASLVSYPALLALGLPPVAANVTNTTAMTAVVPASAISAREELRGEGRQVVSLSLAAAAGGGIGAALLLATPAEVFETAVPWLIAFGSFVLLLRNRIRSVVVRLERQTRRPASRSWPWTTAIMIAGVYAGYFGAAAGIIMLAIISLRLAVPLAVSNAIKTVVTGAANLVAALAYALVAPVDWRAAGGLAVGLIIGSLVGPRLARRIPAEPLRYMIGLSGLALAMSLAVA